MPNLLRAVLLCLPLLSLAGCSTNPATGGQSFTAFMSRSDEMRVGAEEHPKILKQFNGAYQEGQVAAYAGRVGAALARVTEVTAMPFTFTVLNTDKVNAFALPGGYVYITRGLLALADDEAEMAGVLAHEIGHVTARHTAQRHSKAIATNLGPARRRAWATSRRSAPKRTCKVSRANKRWRPTCWAPAISPAPATTSAP